MKSTIWTINTSASNESNLPIFDTFQKQIPKDIQCHLCKCVLISMCTGIFVLVTLFVFVFLIFHTQLAYNEENRDKPQCNCKNLVNKFGIGNCKIWFQYSQSSASFQQRRSCFVNQPSGCWDVKNSSEPEGEQYSFAACSYRKDGVHDNYYHQDDESEAADNEYGDDEWSWKDDK